MKIGIDSRLYSSRFTGIGRYVKELVDRVVRHDPENEYVLFFNEPEYSQYELPAPNVKKVKVNAKHYSVQEQTSFLQALNAANLDLVHFTHFNAPVLYTKPSVVTIHDLTLHKFPGQHKHSAFHKLAYRATIRTIAKKATRIITVSEHTKKDTVELLGVGAEKISVIYEGIAPLFRPVTDDAVMSTALAKYGIQKPYFFYTGAWREHKNILHLVRAFNIFRNHADTQVKLVLGGATESNPYADEVRASISELGLSQHVITPGHIDEVDLPALYSGAVLFAFPSLYEGFGLPPLESFACGTPVVCSDVTSIPEMCGDAAEYFDPTDIQSMARALNIVFESETRQAKLVQAGLKRAKQFSWEKMAEETIALYQSISTTTTSPVAS